MANKTVVLKDSEGNSIYPNVVKENLPASAVFYDDEGAGPEGGVETPSGGGSEMHCYDVWYQDQDNEIYLTFFSNKTVLGLTQPKQTAHYKSMTDLPEFFPPVDTFPRIPCVGYHKDSSGNKVAVMTMEINNLPTSPSSLKGTWQPYSINGNLSVFLQTERKLTVVRRY